MGESYDLSSHGDVSLANLSDAGDCVRAALDGRRVLLQGVKYDAAADAILLDATYDSVLPIGVTLTRQPDVDRLAMRTTMESYVRSSSWALAKFAHPRAPSPPWSGVREPADDESGEFVTATVAAVRRDGGAEVAMADGRREVVPASRHEGEVFL